MELSNTLYSPERGVPGQIYLGDRIEAVRSLLALAQREVESLDQLSSLDQKFSGDEKFCLTREVERFEIDLIRLALLKTHGHQRRAARLLGIKATTLNFKIKRYGIDFRTIGSGDELIA